jgi:prophage regulatory protein
MPESILRLPAVMAKTGFCRTKIYQLIKDGDFPAPIKLGTRSSGWLESEVDAWVRSRPRKNLGPLWPFNQYGFCQSLGRHIRP